MSQNYIVKGTIKGTGKPIESKIVAQSEKNAEMIARDRGIEVTSVLLEGAVPVPVIAATKPVMGLAVFAGIGHEAGHVELSETLQDNTGYANIIWALGAGVISAAMHGLLILLIMLVPFENGPVQAAKLDEPTKIEESEPEPETK